MYLNDHERTEFYSVIGLDAKEFDKYVIRKTNQSAKTLFPVILDVDHPSFFKILDLCTTINQKVIKLEKTSSLSIVKFFKKIAYYFIIFSSLLKLYFLPAIETKYIWTEKE
jgi:magnesium-protoporphyrin IX monomethyl ester (oxidative) cyclase